MRLTKTACFRTSRSLAAACGAAGHMAAAGDASAGALRPTTAATATMEATVRTTAATAIAAGGGN